jgi:hypothetical protein
MRTADVVRTAFVAPAYSRGLTFDEMADGRVSTRGEAGRADLRPCDLKDD